MRAEERGSRPTGRLLILVITALLLAPVAAKAAPTQTLVQDVLYRADGGAAQGRITIQWNAFSTAGGDAVPAGEMTATIGADGSISIPLIPNTGSTPSGSYYQVTIKLDDGTTSQEKWVVPDAPTTTVAAIRANVVPQTVAAQFATRDYVDTAVANLSSANTVHLSGAETITGVKTFTVSPEVPSPADAGSAVAKSYVDQQMASLAPVASTGSYNDLSNQPSIPNLASPGAIGATAPGTVNATQYSVNGTPLASSNLSDSSNLAKLDQANTFTQPQTLSSMISAYSPAADIYAYGARCDGTTDNTAALQAAINALGTNGGVILVPGIGSGCYVANPTSIAWPSLTNTLTIRLQGKLITGSTLVLPNFVDIEGEGGSVGTQFASGGPVARIQGPTSAPTLGTPCTAGSACTFTPSSMSGVVAGGAITVAEQTTCTISSISRSSNVVTATLSGACHTPPIMSVTVAGVTDSGFNGSFIVSAADYSANTLTWTQNGSDASSSGGTVAGWNEDLQETAVITATTATTATATFVNDHTSGARFGIVGVYLTGFTHHALRNLSVSASGVAIWAYQASQIHMDNVSAQAALPWQGALEFNESFWNYINNSSFLTANNAAAWSIRFTNKDLSSIYGSGFTYITNSIFSGGIKLDRGTSYGQGNIYLTNDVSETTARGAITVDPTGSSVQLLSLDNVFLQDNFNGAHQCMVSYLSADTSGTVKINGANTAGSSCLTNPNFHGALAANGVQGSVDPRGATWGASSNDGHGFTIGNGRVTETELRGEGANLSPSLIPYATLPVPDVASWSGGGCTLTSGVLSPDGTSDAISLTGNTSFTPYSYSTTPAVGDWVLWGGVGQGPEQCSNRRL